MPIKGIQQPDMIRVNDSVRLGKFDGAFDFALPYVSL